MRMINDNEPCIGEAIEPLLWHMSSNHQSINDLFEISQEVKLRCPDNY